MVSIDAPGVFLVIAVVFFFGNVKDGQQGIVCVLVWVDFGGLKASAVLDGVVSGF